MLVFTAEVEGEASGFTPRGETCVIVEARLVGASVVIDDGLPEMEAVAKRRVGDAAEYRVGALKFSVNGALAEIVFEARSNFVQDAGIDVPCLLVVAVRIDAVCGVLQHVQNTQTGPGAQAEKCGIQITQAL